MKIVNKYTFRQPHLSGTTGAYLNLPISQTPGLAGQQEIIDKNFVDIEVEKSINAIFDYEKVRFIPRSLDESSDVDYINYELIFDNGGNNWGIPEMDFSFNDFNERKNSYLKTFLRLDFYDTDVGTSQRLLNFITLYPSFKGYYQPNGDAPLPTNFPTTFTTGNSLRYPDVKSEGFFFYYFKDEVLPTVPKEMYMRATLLNAKTGKAIRFMSTDTAQPIDVLAKEGSGKLYTKYILKRDQYGYYYTIDDNYSDNITYNTTDRIYTVRLNQIAVT